MSRSQAPYIAGDTIEEVVVRYHRYLSRNRDLADHYKQFKKREDSDPKAAEAEAIVFSLLRAEKLRPELFEEVSTGGPDFRCTAQRMSRLLWRSPHWIRRWSRNGLGCRRASPARRWRVRSCH
jgi:hypothetical protein